MLILYILFVVLSTSTVISYHPGLERKFYEIKIPIQLLLVPVSPSVGWIVDTNKEKKEKRVINEIRKKKHLF